MTQTIGKSKLRQFLKLDYLTSSIKEMAHLNVIILAAAILITVLFQNLVIVVGLLMFILNSFVMIAFQESDKYKMDVLYIILNVERKTVVKGRLIFAYVTLAIGVAITAVFVGIGFLAEFAFEINLNAAVAAGMTAVMAVTQVIIQGVQVAVTFKKGMKGSNVFIQLPLLGIILLVGTAVSFLGNEGRIDVVMEFLANPVALIAIVSGVAGILAATVYGLYRLALRYYSAREF